MIIVDERTDEEKLRELLWRPEEEGLDFKSKISLERGRSELEFAKDVLSISNRPDGGYIILGAQDDGTPCHPMGTCPDRRAFDAAALQQRVRKYTDAPVRIISAWHEVDGQELLLLCIPPRPEGLPAPMSKDGAYTEDGKDRFAFHQGQVWVRVGTSNSPIAYAHWGTALERHDRRIRADAAAPMQDILTRFTQALTVAPVGKPPLSEDLDLESLANAVDIYFAEDSTRPVLRLVSRFANASEVVGEDAVRRLNQLTVIAVRAIVDGRLDVADSVLDCLFRVYSRLERGMDGARFEMVTRLYVIGAQAVRAGAWSAIPRIVLRPISEPGGYTYSSWIRHAQVSASRANLYLSSHDGMMISLARKLLVEHPALRPDVPDSNLPAEVRPNVPDVLLDSLCSFDFAYCLLVEARGDGEAGAYPAACAFSSERVESFVQELLKDERMRVALLGDLDEDSAAKAIVNVYEFAETQARQGGRFFTWRPTYGVQQQLSR